MLLFQCATLARDENENGALESAVIHRKSYFLPSAAAAASLHYSWRRSPPQHRARFNGAALLDQPIGDPCLKLQKIPRLIAHALVDVRLFQLHHFQSPQSGAWNLNVNSISTRSASASAISCALVIRPRSRSGVPSGVDVYAVAGSSAAITAILSGSAAA